MVSVIGPNASFSLGFGAGFRRLLLDQKTHRAFESGIFPRRAIGFLLVPVKCMSRHRIKSGIQAIAHSECEFMRIVGLLQVMEAMLQDKILADDIRAVTAGEKDFDAWLVGLQSFGEFAPIHPVGHDQVGEDQIDLRGMLTPEFQCFHPRFGLPGLGIRG